MTRWPLRRTRTYYQYYTNVTYSTCSACLSLHGQIAKSSSEFPSCLSGCARHILKFSRRELKERQKQEKKMRLVAKRESVRRQLFSAAEKALASDRKKALSLFQRSAQLELYIPEVEALCHKHANLLQSFPQLSNELRTIFVKAFSDKFGRPRYERLSEPMRNKLEQAGIVQIRELFE
ncbi:hypothetical protein LR021_03010 [Candidatus Bipolaricaulota bacterium]|nr:hypothetical protein [Candidatus Bipolaricaulota bacterium]